MTTLQESVTPDTARIIIGHEVLWQQSHLTLACFGVDGFAHKCPKFNVSLDAPHQGLEFEPS